MAESYKRPRHEFCIFGGTSMASLLTCLLCALSVGATALFDRNLAYLSPYADHPEVHIVDSFA
jgi:hypothetical protein